MDYQQVVYRFRYLLRQAVLLPLGVSRGTERLRTSVAVTTAKPLFAVQLSVFGRAVN